MVRRKNEGSFGCEAVVRVLGQPNVPDVGGVSFFFLDYMQQKHQTYCFIVFFLDFLPTITYISTINNF